MRPAHRTIEYWQDMIEQHNKGRQTRRIANRGKILVIRTYHGFASHRLQLLPTGEMDGNRFVGDPTKPFHLSVFDVSPEHAIHVDPQTRTYTQGSWLWHPVGGAHTQCLPPGLSWGFEYATRWVPGHTRLWGEYEGGPQSWRPRMKIHAPLDGPITVTGGVPVRQDDVTPTKMAQLRRLKRDLLRIIAPYEAMRMSSPPDHPVFGTEARAEVRKRPMHEVEAEVMELVNQGDDELYMPGYQALATYGAYRWRSSPQPTEEMVAAFMRHMKRKTYTTAVQP